MKVVITRPRSQPNTFAESLADAGFEPVFFPVIEIRPAEDLTELDAAIGDIASYDWVIFTSANTVEIFFEHAPAAAIAMPKVATIGRKTADALRPHGIEPDFVPDEYVGEAILPGLGNVQGKRILMPCAELARQALPGAIREQGGMLHEIVVYRTLPAQPNVDGLQALKAGVGVITLTSPSTVQNFIAIVKAHGLDPLDLPGRPLFACIGPITEGAARDEGLAPLVTAGEFTTEGLIEIISKYAASLEVQ